MDVAYIYRRPRSHFGQQLNLENWPQEVNDEDSENIILIPGNKDFVQRTGMVHMKPCVIELDTSPEVGCSTVATNPTVRCERGMTHQEGGWPSEIDVDDEAALTRFRKRREKGTKTKGSGSAVEPLGASVKRLGPVVSLAVKQNNTINIYEEYFDEFLPVRSS